jgi:hypothetical protein
MFESRKSRRVVGSSGRRVVGSSGRLSSGFTRGLTWPGSNNRVHVRFWKTGVRINFYSNPSPSSRSGHARRNSMIRKTVIDIIINKRVARPGFMSVGGLMTPFICVFDCLCVHACVPLFRCILLIVVCFFLMSWIAFP